MPISKDMLTEGEEVLVDTHPHLEFLIRPFLATVAAVALLAVVEAETHKLGTVPRDILLVVVAVPVIWLIVRIVKWASISLTVTNRRLDYKQGVLRRNTLQLRYQRISEVQCDQTFLGRLIGVGKLHFEVQGEGEPIVIPDVRKVRAMQRLINQLLDQLSYPGAGPDAGPGVPTAVPPGPGAVVQPPAVPAAHPVSVHDQLIQLDDLYQRGILTAEEFQAKKADLLDRL